MRQADKKERFIYILTLFYMVPLAVFLVANTFFSLTQTTYMELYLDVEKPLYKADSPLILLAFSTVFLVLCGSIFRKWEISNRICRTVEHITLIYVTVICLIIVFLIRATLTCDSAALNEIALAFLEGDYSSFAKDEYLSHYPFQLGMVAFIQLIYYLFGVNHYIMLQLLNIAAIFSVIYYLHRITRELFDDNRIQLMFSLLCLGMLPLYLYVVFVYGDIPGLGFAVPAIYYTIRYINTEKLKSYIPLIVCMNFAMILKSTNIVILIAIVIILLLHAIRRKNWFIVLSAVILMIGSSVGNKCIGAYYANAAGLEGIPSGAPKIAWVAMGLQENDYVENGWYNGFNWATYSYYQQDSQKTAEASMESIRNSLQSFIAAPRSSGLAFFYKKFISQWNDPGYLSQIVIEWYSRHRDDHSSLALYLIYGNGRVLLENCMNMYQFIILIGSSIFALQSIRKCKWSLPAAFLALCVFGGYFLYIFWEAKSRYALGYFVMCTPMAAYGLCEIIQAVPVVLNRWISKLRQYFHK